MKSFLEVIHGVTDKAGHRLYTYTFRVTKLPTCLALISCAVYGREWGLIICSQRATGQLDEVLTHEKFYLADPDWSSSVKYVASYCGQIGLNITANLYATILCRCHKL